MTDETNSLPPGFSLHRYLIEGILGAGGFGITYRAMHEALENEVAIKEYFPAEWAYRDHNGITVRANAQGQIPARSGEPPCYDWGLQRFLDEAKILVQINHPGVVRVRDYFTANGSAYIVMEFEEGESLSTSLQRGGILPEQELRRLLDDVLPALEAVHGQGYLHRDLKPSNLYVRNRDGHVMLIDFGAARQALGRRTRSVTSVVTPGYLPIEQYVTVSDDYCPWTDIYALGAVRYRCITGAPPVEAPGRVLKDPVQPAIEAGAGLYSRDLLQMVDRALAVRPEERFQSVAEMRTALREAERSPQQVDFSQVPPIAPEILDLLPRDEAPPLQFTPISQPSEPAQRDAWDNSSRIRLERRSMPSRQQATPAESRSTPSHRAGGPRAVTAAELQPAFDEPPPPRKSESDSLPLLDNIWEHLDELSQLTAPDTEAEARDQVEAGPAPPASLQQPPHPTATDSDSAARLLKRTPQSAVEHLRKLSTARNIDEPADRPSARGNAEARSTALTGSDIAIITEIPITPPVRPPINWRRILLTVFVVCGLSGTGLLGHEYYNALQDQQQRQQSALHQQEQEAEALRAQQEAERINAEINRNIEQARSAINSREWARASVYLERAAALGPSHPAVAALREQLKAIQHPGEQRSRTEKTTGMRLQWIEGGCFDMGSPASERDRGQDERPHQVCVKGFWIGQNEITNGQYRRFRPDHDSGTTQNRSLNADNQPAVNLSWNDAAAFTEWLSWEAERGQRFRLPTEAEWEYAIRAGTTSRYYWGDEIDPLYANFSDRNDPTGASIGNLDDGQAVTAPVGRYRANAWNLYDMAGNVWEWTCSEYDSRYSGPELACVERRGGEGQRVVRGGSWNNGPGDLRSARRLARAPGQRDAMTGFRVVLEERSE